MSPDSLQLLRNLAADNRWAVLLPELALGGLAVALLLLEIALPRRVVETWIPRLAIAGPVAVGLWVVHAFSAIDPTRATFNGLLLQTPDSQRLRLFFLGAAALVGFVAAVVLPRHKAPRVEFFHILLVATAGLMLLGQSHHFVMLFVALETVTVALYVLVAYFRENPLSLEAGLKYLVMGALSSALLLFGIVLLYGVAGNPLLAGHTAQAMNFAELGAFLHLHPDHPLALVGAGLVLAGVAFKIGAVPFQIWVPDVYQGAPTPVTAFLAVASKAAGFAVLLLLVKGPFLPLAHVTRPLLTVFAVLSLLFGNLAALGQQNVKRLMGLSGVAHAGFLLIGVVAAISKEDAVAWAPAAVNFYLWTYLLGAMTVFGVMAHLAGPDDADQTLRDYAQLARRSPLLGGVLAVGLGSLAGIPPLAGFMAKVLLFVAAFQAHQWVLLGVAIIAVVISIFYYFAWIRAAYFDPPSPAGNPPAIVPVVIGTGARVTLVALALATVALGLYQGPLGHWLAQR